MQNENENPNEKNPHLNEFQQNEINRILQSATTRQEVENELRTEPRFKNFFEGYTTTSVESFITTYKAFKTMLLQNGPHWNEWDEADSLKWINEAKEHLAIIQQKKLFDAQCLWRAEQLEIPDVHLCIDFDIWEANVLRCPFIEPITEADIELYAQFLNQPNADFALGWFEGWQDYEEIKEAYHSENVNRNFPEWYDFHINRKGGSHLLSLPDIRGDKETFYMNLWRNHNAIQNKQQTEEWERTRDKRPSLKSIYDPEFARFFISTFESKELLHYYELYLKRHGDDDNEEIETIVSDLLKENQPIPIQAHHNWREALKIAHASLRAQKIADHLPNAFEEFQLQLSLGLEGENELKHFNDMKNLKQGWIDSILKGRELNGEPRDLDF